MRQMLSAYQTLAANRWVRLVALTLYYLAILLALLALYSQGDHTPPPFIYQGF